MQHPVEARSREMCWLVVAGAVASMVAACVKTPDGGGRETTRARARAGTSAGTSAGTPAAGPASAQDQAAATAAALLMSMGWTCPDGAFAGSFTAPGTPECAALRVEEGDPGDADGDVGARDADDDDDDDDAADDDGADGDDADDDGADGDDADDDGVDTAGDGAHTAYLDIQGVGGVVSMPLVTWTAGAARASEVAIAGVLPLVDVGAHGVVVMHTDTDHGATRDEVVVYVVREGRVQPIGSVYGPFVLVDRIDGAGVHARVVEGAVVNGEPARGARVQAVVMRYANGAIAVESEDR